MKREMTEEELIAWADWLAKLFNSSFFSKEEEEMKIVSEFLDTLGIIDKETFLKRCSTTIGNRIYLHFRIGDPAYPYAYQRSLIVHELTHSFDYSRLGIEFMARYADPAERAEKWEYRGYLAQITMEYKCDGIIPDTRALSQNLVTYYACKQENADTMKVLLDVGFEAVVNGGEIGPVEQQALGRLRELDFL